MALIFLSYFLLKKKKTLYDNGETIDLCHSLLYVVCIKEVAYERSSNYKLKKSEEQLQNKDKNNKYELKIYNIYIFENVNNKMNHYNFINVVM